MTPSKAVLLQADLRIVDQGPRTRRLSICRASFRIWQPFGHVDRVPRAWSYLDEAEAPTIKELTI